MRYLSYILALFTFLKVSGQAEPAPFVGDNKNWTSSITYNFSGIPISKGVNYFNDLGKAQQQQSWDVLTNRVWATEVRYDYFNRSVLQSLSAPINCISLFGYRPDFILSGGVNLGINQYDSSSTLFTPPLISNDAGSLGWYYSTQNSLDPYQDITSYPYTRVVYSELNPGTIRAVLGGNKTAGEWKQSYSFTMPCDKDSNLRFTGGLSTLKVLKTVNRNVDGIETVVFTDTDGNLVGAARSGNEAGAVYRPTTSTILDKGYVDIHIAKGCMGVVTLSNYDPLKHNIKVYDLITETTVVPSYFPTGYNVLQPGFYRIEDTNNYYGKNNSVATPVSPIVVNYRVNYYDFSVNKYDDANRLISSTQPLGADTPTPLVSNYSYNTLGQLTAATSPDEGTSSFLYRNDGQIRFSQNSEQAKVHTFSYTNYDDLGRPIESGVYNGNEISYESASGIVDQNQALPTDSRIEQNFSVYDLPDEDLKKWLEECKLPTNEYTQTYISGNVSYTYTQNPFTTKTWYSYDVYGRVRWMIQQISGLSCLKTIDYTYNPVDGQLIRVEYQKFSPSERFIHKYQYNPAGQLTDVYTSFNNTLFTKQAHYGYNESGSLNRTELATNLQGIDYIYNLNGQLKAINHPSIMPSNDPGADGVSGSSSFPGDVFGMAIDYYSGDYLRTNTPKPVTTTPQGVNQYNGNIKATRWNTQTPSSNQNAYTYTYNKNNWLTGATFGSADVNGAITYNPNSDYKVSNISYDANGNILTLNRKGYTDSAGTNKMDNLTYRYGTNASNRLLSVSDSDDNPDPDRYNDIKDQSLSTTAGGGSTSDNYVYNDLGELTVNYQDKIFYEYNASGLVTRIKTFATQDNAEEYKTMVYDDYSHFTSTNHGWVQKTGVNPNTTAAIPFTLADYSQNIATNCEMDNAAVYGDIPNLLQINGKTTVYRKFRVTQNSTFRLNFDMLLDNYIESGVDPFLEPNNNPGSPSVILDADGNPIPTPNPQYFDPVTITPYVTISLKRPDDTVVYNNTITTDGSLTNYCDRYYAAHIDTGNFTTNSEEYLTLELKIYNNLTDGSSATSPTNLASKKQVTYLDNLKVEAATTTKVAFYYNDRGQRVQKDNIMSADNKISTFYVRDASGNCISIYQANSSEEISFGGNTLKEQTIFGTGRIGIYKRNDGKKGTYPLYELTDNLGNVRAVIRKTSAGAVVLTGKTDYYPFGMPMPNTEITDQNYRYAFQGQEKDPETGMEAFELRLWDGRLGRWLTVDPYGQFDSPYIGMGNNPISMIDPDGGRSTGAPSKENCSDGDTWFNGTDNFTMVGGEWTTQLNEVVVMNNFTHSDTWAGVKAYVVELSQQAAVIGTTMFTTAKTNEITFGIVQQPYFFKNTKFELAERLGRLGGDALTFVQGVDEFIIGGGTEIFTLGSSSAVSIPIALHGTALLAGSGYAGVGEISGIVDYMSRRGHGSGGGSESKPSIPKGFKETKKFGRSHGQKIYEYKGRYYSRDVDSHNGGVWKVFEVKSGRLERIGTADENLKIFKE